MFKTITVIYSPAVFWTYVILTSRSLIFIFSKGKLAKGPTKARKRRAGLVVGVQGTPSPEGLLVSPGNKLRPVETGINAKCGNLKEWLLLD